MPAEGQPCRRSKLQQLVSSFRLSLTSILTNPQKDLVLDAGISAMVEGEDPLLQARTGIMKYTRHIKWPGTLMRSLWLWRSGCTIVSIAQRLVWIEHVYCVYYEVKNGSSCVMKRKEYEPRWFPWHRLESISLRLKSTNIKHVHNLRLIIIAPFQDMYFSCEEYDSIQIFGYPFCNAIQIGRYVAALPYKPEF